jgi:hypothetical protein
VQLLAIIWVSSRHPRSLEQITESTVSIAVQGAWPDQSIADYEGNAAVAVVGRVVWMGAERRTIQELDPVENSWERVGAAAASPSVGRSADG